MAPIASPGMRVILKGDRSGGELWETTFWLGGAPDNMDQGKMDASTLAIANLFQSKAWSPVTTGLKAYSSPATRFTGAKAYLYPAGSEVASLIADQTILDPNVGTSTTPHPYSNAIVCSLYTATPTRSGRGRMYLPCDGIGMGPTGQYVGSTVTNTAALMKAFFDAVNGATLPGLTLQRVCVASRTQGVARAVTRIIVDSLPDTQRRRDDKLLAGAVSSQTISV